MRTKSFRMPTRRSKLASRIAAAPLRPGRVRAGSATVELLLNLPIWLLVLLATVEFGEVQSNLQQVSLASRVGAEEASETCPLPATGEVPSNIVEAVERQLYNSGMSCAKLILEHNEGGDLARLVAGGGPGDPPGSPLPAVGTYVRVTIFARGNHFGSHLLGFFGFNFTSRVLGQSTTFRYER